MAVIASPPRRQPDGSSGVSALLHQRVLANSAWLIGDKLLRLGLGLVVTVWMARHFGPATFGVWNYAIAYVAIFAAVATLGMDGVIVRELVRIDADAGAILGTGLLLRLFVAAVLAIAATVSMHWVRPDQWLPALLVGANAAVMLLQSSQVFDYHFQARMHSRPAVIAANAAYVAAMLLRLGLLAADAPIAWFGATLVVEAAIAALLLWLAWRSDSAGTVRWRWHLPVARELVRESWPLMFSSLAVILYMRLDQIMLASMVGDQEVGQFSAALRIAEIWYFIPMSIVTAAFPAILAKRREDSAAYERYMQQLYDGLAWLGIAVAALVTVFAEPAVRLLYGPAYEQAARILTIQIWAGVAVSMSFVHSRWLLAEGLQRYGLLYTVIAATLNVMLNLLLIPSHGAVGAAWATVITQIGVLPVQLLLPKARRNFVLMARTIAAPWRALLSLRAGQP
jgi:O-antigen/teichoic acid export membrane protein